ncbi:MAG: peptidoglycan editing factor PgeF [Tannerellaceae bacterium]|jgi:YfiH family protein|nr:peptidoglycan editing factor PgeF [Tannerellaceae bacterium]
MRTEPSDNRLPGLKRFSILEKIPRLMHFITTRRGGVSTGAYASLNLGEYTSDDPEAVRRNKELLCEALGMDLAQLCIPRQVHGDEVVLLDAPFPSSRPLDADALITASPGICLAVATADCVPLLFYDPEREVLAAVHAGWRGTALGIARKTIRRMKQTFGCNPAGILAGIGPSIGCRAFEVGEEVCGAFIASGIDPSGIFLRDASTDRMHVDLKEANRKQLLNEGLRREHIEVSEICTYTHHRDYFSARREGLCSGRILTGILLKS